MTMTTRIKRLDIFLFSIAVMILLFSVHTASANYHFDGVPYTDQLKETQRGTIQGGVYIDGGYGVDRSPYTQSFNVPDGTVKWARL
jgi:subtilase family serine protease